MYIYMYKHICIYVYIFIYIYMYVYIYMCVCGCVDVCILDALDDEPNRRNSSPKTRSKQKKLESKYTVKKDSRGT